MIKNLLNLFKKQKKQKGSIQVQKPRKSRVESTRIGEIGEYKINVQLDQLPKTWRYFDDLLIRNPRSKTGYSQIDHVVINPYGVFVIETKNYSGEIKGLKADKYWYVNNKFKMYSPLFQNYGHIQTLKEVLKDFKNISFISMISFTMRCRFNIDPELRKISSDELVIYDVELTEFIQRKINRIKIDQSESIIKESEIEEIARLIQNANITDRNIRNEHNRKANQKN
jgi:hypothetical protein